MIIHTIASDSKNRNFGLLAAFVILVTCIPGFWKTGNLNFYWITIGVIVIMIAFLKAGWLYYPHLWWEKVAYYLALINTTILLLIIYFLFFFPISMVFKLTKRDPLNRKIEPGRSTYWEIRDEQFQSLPKNQF